MKPFLTHKEIIWGYFPDILTQFEFIPFSLSSPPMRQFFRKISNDDYVIRDDVVGYPDKSTDSSWPNEQSGITSFYELWDRKFGESLARVSLNHFETRETLVEYFCEYIKLNMIFIVEKRQGHREGLNKLDKVRDIIMIFMKQDRIEMDGTRIKNLFGRFGMLLFLLQSFI